MKKYIREMLDDLQRKKDKDYIPTIPPPSTGGKVTDLEPKPEPAMPNDLQNQILSKDSLERVKQLDYQAQKNTERENGG
jgi:hypothetical protein